MADRPGFGLYVHWPFCQAKCPYCDFNSHVVASIDQARWRNALVSEILRYQSETPGRVLQSIFFGGGTPSLMPPETVADVVDAALSGWVPSNDMEITLEANPTSVEISRFYGYAEAGVNRVSIGVQSLRNPDLKALGRLHSAEEALRAFETARSVFPRVSFDLIYARQNQGLADWRKELTEALAMRPDHLSLYQLTIEEGTAFGERLARGGLAGLPNEDVSADMFEVTQELTEAAGLFAYETSNHALAGQESRHNLIYWRSGDWVGVGPGAHGRLTLSGQRWATEALSAPGAWLSAVEGSGSGEVRREAVSAQMALEERVIMGLRLREGVRSFELLDSYSSKINTLEDAGLVEIKDGALLATPIGWPVLNYIIRELLA